jgi:RNA polymerase sigma factor for flagellar operon FliA
VSSHLYGFEDLGIDETMLKGEAVHCSEPHERVLHEDMSQYLSSLVKTLPQQEQLVLALYYERELNLKEIGDVLEVSESRVSQIHSQALIHLKERT